MGRRKGEKIMKIPAEFEDIFRGVELTEREALFLSWITSWDDYTIQNMRTVLGKVITGQILGITPDRLLELAQADREGKIPKYTIGDTIYDRFGDAWEVKTAERHLLGEKPDWLYRCGHAGTDDYCALWSFEILTREEAEAALRREQDG